MGVLAMLGDVITNRMAATMNAIQVDLTIFAFILVLIIFYILIKFNSIIIAIKPKSPFKPVFQVAAPRGGSDIRILNEPLEGSAVFLVETGESRIRPEATLCFV